MHFVLLLLALIFTSTQPRLVNSHEEKGKWSCDSPSDIRVNAEFRPGIVTLDGHAHDWKNIDGFEFPLLIAVNPDPESEYNGGKMTVKVNLFIYYVYVSFVCVYFMSILFCF